MLASCVMCVSFRVTENCITTVKCDSSKVGKM